MSQTSHRKSVFCSHQTLTAVQVTQSRGHAAAHRAASGCILALVSDVHQHSTTALCCADTLSDPVSRQLYDQYGPDGMQQHPGAASGRGNAREAWDEFKPFTRTNKHTQARDAAGSTAGVGGGARWAVFGMGKHAELQPAMQQWHCCHEVLPMSL